MIVSSCHRLRQAHAGPRERQHHFALYPRPPRRIVCAVSGRLRGSVSVMLKMQVAVAGRMVDAWMDDKRRWHSTEWWLTGYLRVIAPRGDLGPWEPDPDAVVAQWVITRFPGSVVVPTDGPAADR